MKKTQNGQISLGIECDHIKQAGLILSWWKGGISTHFPPPPEKRIKADTDKKVELLKNAHNQTADNTPKQPEPLNFCGYRECAHVESIVLFSKC